MKKNTPLTSNSRNAPTRNSAHPALLGLPRGSQSLSSHDRGENCAATRPAFASAPLLVETPPQASSRPPLRRSRAPRPLSRDRSSAAVAIPSSIPTRLHTATSSTHRSHQHSRKLGNACARAASASSKPTESGQSRRRSRRRIALAHQPRACATTNSSRSVDLRAARLSSWEEKREKGGEREEPSPLAAAAGAFLRRRPQSPS